MVRGTGISLKLTIVVEYMPDIFIILFGKFKTKRGGGRSFRSVPPRFSIDAKSLKRESSRHLIIDENGTAVSADRRCAAYAVVTPFAILNE
jgi:hypothetical protein